MMGEQAAGLKIVVGGVGGGGQSEMIARID